MWRPGGAASRPSARWSSARSTPGHRACLQRPRAGRHHLPPALMADLTSSAARRLHQRFNDRPGDFVGQEVVRLSTTPVLRDGRLEPAPFVLRVYAAATPDGMRVMPGGFCRTSSARRARHLHGRGRAHLRRLGHRRQAGGARVSLLASADEVKVRRILGHLPSRAADNLFWLGRYLERAEATLRLVRSLCTSLMDSEAAVHSTGETLDRLQQILVAWGAFDEDAVGRPRPDRRQRRPARREAVGSVIAWSARRAAPPPACASGCRPTSGPCCSIWRAAWRKRRRPALRSRGPAAGRARAADPGRPVRPGAGEHEPRRRLALPRHGPAHRAGDQHLPVRPHRWPATTPPSTTSTCCSTSADSQITYRARYLVGLALVPARDMVMLDPFNTRSLAFQVVAIKAAPGRAAVAARRRHAGGARPHPAAAGHRRGDRGRRRAWTPRPCSAFEQTLMRLSDAIADRYFLQGANARAHRQARRAGVIYWVRHRTTYTYEAEVTYARCVLRLTPPTNADQTRAGKRSSPSRPSPPSGLQRTGPFGEQTLTVVIDKPHQSPGHRGDSWVDRPSAAGRPTAAASPAWEAVRAAATRRLGARARQPGRLSLPDAAHAAVAGDHRLRAGELPARPADRRGRQRPDEPHPRRLRL